MTFEQWNDPKIAWDDARKYVHNQFDGLESDFQLLDETLLDVFFDSRFEPGSEARLKCHQQSVQDEIKVLQDLLTGLKESGEAEQNQEAARIVIRYHERLKQHNSALDSELSSLATAKANLLNRIDTIHEDLIDPPTVQHQKITGNPDPVQTQEVARKFSTVPDNAPVNPPKLSLVGPILTTQAISHRLRVHDSTIRHHIRNQKRNDFPYELVIDNMPILGKRYAVLGKDKRDRHRFQQIQDDDAASPIEDQEHP
jgi:hypothetical protein